MQRFHAQLFPTPRGLALAGVILAQRHPDGTFVFAEGEEALHAPLQAAYGRPVSPRALRYVQRGCELLAQVSDDALEQAAYPFHPNPHAITAINPEESPLVKGLMMLALSGLNTVEHVDESKQRLLKMQAAPERAVLLKAYGLPTWAELTKVESEVDADEEDGDEATGNSANSNGGSGGGYNPDEPRIVAGQEGGGQWTTEGNGVCGNLGSFSADDIRTMLLERSRAPSPSWQDAVITDIAAEQDGEWKQGWLDQPHAELRDFIANQEEPNMDKNDSYGYANIHHSTDALGRYQLTPVALQDIGLKDENGNWAKDTDFYNTYHIASDTDFLQNEDAQEAAMTVFMQRLDQQTSRAQQYLGTTYTGVSGQSITVTMSGIIAAGQRAGGRAVNNYFNAYQGEDTLDRELSPQYLSIETRIRLAQKVPY